MRLVRPSETMASGGETFGDPITVPFELAKDDPDSVMLGLNFPKHNMLDVVRIFTYFFDLLRR